MTDIRCDIDDKGDGRIATLTVDNTAKLNVIGGGAMDDLSGALRELGGDEALRAVVLTGAGERAFIGGADIGEMAALTPASATVFITTLHGVCTAIRALPVPVIARIRGYCLGAGLEVAAACDLRLADDTAVFGMPEVRVGLPSVIEAALLPRLIGWGRASRLLYTGDIIDAAKALDWGLVEEVTAPEGLDNAVAAVTASICAAGPRAIRAQKELMRQWEGLMPAEAIKAGVATFARAFRNDEPAVYLNRFLNRKR
jgi:enoyl-CoA hydratase/carnithine racemase